MNETEKDFEPFYSAVIFQAVVCMAVLLTVLCIKFTWAKGYKCIKNFYDTKICEDTDIKDVTDYIKGLK